MIFVLNKLSFYNFIALEVRESEDHAGTGLAVAFDDRFDEIDKIVSVDFIELYDHSHINYIYFYLFCASSK